MASRRDHAHNAHSKSPGAVSGKINFTFEQFIDFFDFISVLRYPKTEDLGLKYTKPITSYQSVPLGTKSVVLKIPTQLVASSTRSTIYYLNIPNSEHVF